MSDRFELRTDLAAIEAQIAATPVASSSIDRDALLYRAGWAAAEAAAQSRPSFKSRGWPALCACLAAVLLIALMTPRGGPSPGGIEEVVGLGVRPPKTEAKQESDDDSTSVAKRLVQRRSELIQQNVAGTRTAIDRNQSAVGVPSRPTVRTRRELLDELLSTNS